MRVSPLLFAILTVSTAFGFAQSATAKAAEDREAIAAIAQPHSDSVVQTRRVKADLPTEVAPSESPLGIDAVGVDSISVAPVSVAPVNPQLAQAPIGQPNEPGPADLPSAPVPDVQITPATPTAPVPQNQAPAPELPVQPAPGATPPGQPNTPTAPAAPAAPQPFQPGDTVPGPTGAPSTPPTAPPGTPPGTPDATQPPAESRVLVGEVVIQGAPNREIEQAAYAAARTEPGRVTTRSQLQEDITAIFATGYFSNVRAVPVDTPLGVRIVFEVTTNPELRAVRLEDSSIETVTYRQQEQPLQAVVDQIFQRQYGQVLNLRDFQGGLAQLQAVYKENGYALANVTAAEPEIGEDGTVVLSIPEGEIEAVQLRFLNRDGDDVDDEGEPIQGRTREYIVTREFETTKPGTVFNERAIGEDLRRAFGLGIFEDLTVSLQPGQDPRKVVVVVNVTERQTGSIAATAGLSTSSGLFGAVSLQENNLGGNNQKLGAEVQVGERDLLFDLSFTDPWIGGDPNRTSYTINAFGRQSISLAFDGGDREVTLPDDPSDNEEENEDDNEDDNLFNDGDRPRVRRYGGGISFSRPLEDRWRASLGLQFQNVSIRDLEGGVVPRDSRGNLLSFNDDGTDNLLTLQFAASQDNRNNGQQSTSGNTLRLSAEQAIPIDGITFTRLRAGYTQYFPVRLLNLTPGCRKDDAKPADCPQALAFNVQGGTIFGDLPPYEAFSLGGDDSVRGYGPGDVGTGRSFAKVTAEYRFPILSIVNGVLFVDAATDLGTGDDVPGDPAGERDKPGSGIGYGAGLRVNTPLGFQVRVDYGISDQGDNRFSFGVGESF
jgi:outer membrane protein insertion porin family